MEYKVTRKSDSLRQNAGTAIGGHIAEASSMFGVPTNLISRVIQKESNGNPFARSPVGAQGLMQLMPGTARQMGVTNPFDIRQNIIGGTKYLAYLGGLVSKRFPGIDDNQKTALILASYNAGFGNVCKYRGVPPFKETKNYVAGIMSRLGSAIEFGTKQVYTAITEAPRNFVSAIRGDLIPSVNALIPLIRMGGDLRNAFQKGIEINSEEKALGDLNAKPNLLNNAKVDNKNRYELPNKKTEYVKETTIKVPEKATVKKEGNIANIVIEAGNDRAQREKQIAVQKTDRSKK